MSKESHAQPECDQPEEGWYHESAADDAAADDNDYEYDPDPEYDPTEHMSQEELDELAREAHLAERDYEAAVVRDALQGISKDKAKAYLSKYGDAVDARIGTCLEQAKQLAAGNPGPALALAATALEITIRFLLLRPLVQGAFLSDRWAAILANRVATGRTAEDREMLPVILREWGIDVTKVQTSGGTHVWPFIVGCLWGLRDKFVHQFDPVAPQVAFQAIDCAQTFRTEVVGTVAKQLGFTLDATQRWSAIRKPNGSVEVSEAADPFGEKVEPKKTQ